MHKFVIIYHTINIRTFYLLLILNKVSTRLFAAYLLLICYLYASICYLYAAYFKNTYLFAAYLLLIFKKKSLRARMLICYFFATSFLRIFTKKSLRARASICYLYAAYFKNTYLFAAYLSLICCLFVTYFADCHLLICYLFATKNKQHISSK